MRKSLRRSLGMKAAAALVLSAVLAGCVAPPAAPPPAPRPLAGGGGRVVALDAGSAGAVACAGIVDWRLADGRLGVLANLRNLGSTRIGLRVLCSFEGTGGSPAGDGGAWQAVVLDPGSTETVRFASPDARAQAYLIRVRSAR